MKITKRKRTVPAKRKSAVPTKHYRTAPAKQYRTAPAKSTAPGEEVAPENPLGRFWTLWVEPEETINIADNIPMCLLVIKNHGPGVIAFYAGYGDQQDLVPGKVRMTSAYAKISIEGKAAKPALVEMQLLPASR